MRTSLVLAGFFVTACGPTNEDYFTPSHGFSPGATAPASDAAAPEAASAPPPATDAGGATDAPAPAPPDAGAPLDAFTGAPPYVAQTGPTTIQAGHTFDPKMNPAGRACLSCHSGFLVGGTIYKDVAGTIPAPQVEVRVRDANGNAASAYTDNVGNFYLRKSSAPNVTIPAEVGARDNVTTVVMQSSPTNGSCAAASCHVTGAQGPVHL